MSPGHVIAAVANVCAQFDVKNCYQVNKANLNLTACIVLIYPFGVLALSCFFACTGSYKKMNFSAIDNA